MHMVFIFDDKEGRPVLFLTSNIITEDIPISVSSVVEFPGAGSSRLRTINSELNGAT